VQNKATLLTISIFLLLVTIVYSPSMGIAIAITPSINESAITPSINESAITPSINESAITPSINESARRTLPSLGDIDRDGLPNVWETKGIDVNHDGIIDLNLRALGANPFHKDIFVEVDYMQFHKPKPQAITDVIGFRLHNVGKGFANAPLSNPDGKRGIKLHVLVDEQIPHQASTDVAGLQTIKNTNFGTVSERSNTNHVNIIAAKKLVFHYCVFAHSQPGTSSSGVSNGIPAMEFLVTLGANGWGVDPATGHTVGTLDQQEGTFMHELGHNLNLRHGGSDNVNNKPNYLSVMNYLFQMSSLVANRPLDYSRCAIAALGENSISEPAGIGPSCPPGLMTFANGMLTTTGIPIDWNNDGDKVDTGILKDLNGDTVLSTLNGFDDWKHLTYRLAAGAITGQPEPSTPEFTVDTLRLHRILLVADIDRSIKNLSSSAFNQSALEVGSLEALDKATQPATGEIAGLLKSDNLDKAIDQLSSLRSKMDSSLGGSSRGELITEPTAQKEIVSKIDNLIGTLEKQR
jgi:hypothetical protein